MTKLLSWGRITNWDHNIIDLIDVTSVKSQLQGSGTGIAYGMGRSYGDVCLNENGCVWRTRKLDHFISFDRESGLLICEAGVVLSDIQALVTQHGWMLPVTPGTQLITLGGAIANDVHGKNHHLHGTFGHHVRHIKIIRTTGEEIICGPDLLPEWFAATVGGLGLTGVIIEASIQLRPIKGPWLDTETISFENLDEFFKLSVTSETEWEYTVAWIDCTSNSRRGIFMRANHSQNTKITIHNNAKYKMLFTPPVSLVNKLTLKPFNVLYFHLKKWKAGKSTLHYEPFFYPLDNLLEWNRLYGKKGFYQFQCVIPFANAQDTIEKLLHLISTSGTGSFLAVLKKFGDVPSLGMLSFAMPGITLALDFPNNGTNTKDLFARLNAIVLNANGRIYCAKDLLMSQEVFNYCYTQIDEFKQFRDPGISSSLSRRLLRF